MSRAGAECVNSPTLMRSTPVAAMLRTVARFTPPDASSNTSAAAAFRRTTAIRKSSSRMLSSKTMSGFLPSGKLKDRIDRGQDQAGGRQAGDHPRSMGDKIGLTLKFGGDYRLACEVAGVVEVFAQCPFHEAAARGGFFRREAHQSKYST